MVELVETFWNERKLIGKIIGAFLVLGLFFALLSPIEYTAEATLLPESQASQGMAGNLLQQYGGLLGIGGGSGGLGQEGMIPPKLYPNIVGSLPFQVELMNTPVHFAAYDTTVTPHTFYSEIYSPFSLIGTIKGYTIGLPGKIVGLFSNQKPSDPVLKKVDRDTILTLSGAQVRTANKLKERLIITSDQGAGIITVESEFPDPQAAAEIGQAGIRLLKEYMREYRTQKATKDLEFVEEQVTEAKKRFEKAQTKLAEFRDSNFSLATAKAQTREQELQSEYDLAFNVYNNLNKQLQQARLQVQEKTPVFSILQPVSVPLSKSAPNTILILFLFGFSGGVVALGWVVVKHWWSSFK